jgi:hypothetical protein
MAKYLGRVFSDAEAAATPTLPVGVPPLHLNNTHILDYTSTTSTRLEL